MAGNAKNLAQFKEQFSSLKQQSIGSKGLTEKQFNRVVASAFKRYEYERSHPAVYWSCKVLKWIFISVFALYTINYAGSVCMQRSRIFDKFVLSMIHDHEILYRTNRLVRLAALPLHSMFDMRRLYYSECLVNNPFATSPTPMCHVCEEFGGIEVLSSSRKKDIKQLTEDKGMPLIAFNDSYYSNHIFTYEELKSLIATNKDVVAAGSCQDLVTSGSPEHGVIDTILEKNSSDIVAMNLAAGWLICDAHATRVMRKLYPRPEFLAQGKEVSIEKYMYMIAPKLEVTMPAPRHNLLIIAQLTGRSKVHLEPSPACNETCKGPIESHLNSGEMLIQPSGAPWTVKVEATSDELSLIHVLQSE